MTTEGPPTPPDEGDQNSHGEDATRDPLYVWPIRNLIEPTLNEIERRENEALAREESLHTAMDRLKEVRRAAAKDHSFDDEYQRAIDRVLELVHEERRASGFAEPDEPDESDDS